MLELETEIFQQQQKERGDWQPQAGGTVRNEQHKFPDAQIAEGNRACSNPQAVSYGLHPSRRCTVFSSSSVWKRGTILLWRRGTICAEEQGVRRLEGKGAQRLEGRGRMRKNNCGMRFIPLRSLTQPARPGTVAGTQATLTPGVNRPVHDKGAQARLSGRAGNHKGVKRRDLNRRPRAKRGGS